ncbi:MAG: hypothetical protein JWM52_599 [Candidatus Saccharibacteria bacterium]|nr:hypothetical protein [Candidatus Saccharibacteria bacterium]
MVERILTRQIVKTESYDPRFPDEKGTIHISDLTPTEQRGARETANFAQQKPTFSPHDIDKMIADAEAYRAAAEQGRVALEHMAAPHIEAPLTRRELRERERSKGIRGFLKNALK